MKGTYKTLITENKNHNKTNFNDWSDPKLKHVRRKVILGPKISKSIIKESFFVEDEPRPVDSSVEDSEYSHTSQNIAELRAKIKDGYTLLTQKEIRNYRLPFYESLLINLKEDGFSGTYQYISDLFDLDEKRHEMKSYGRIPYLKSRIDILTSLCNGLVKAEVAKLEGDKLTEIRALLDLAVCLSEKSHDTMGDKKGDSQNWKWLAEELYDQSVHVADSYTCASTVKLGAIAKHLFADFLLNSTHDPKRAKRFVEESLEQSMGKSWTAAEVTGKKSDILYIESCLLMHKIFIAIAQEQVGDVDESIKLCRSALYWAKQVNSKSAEATALKQLVMTYLSAGQLNAVPDHLAKYMSLCEELNDVSGICDGYILYATYHDLEDEQESVVLNIQELMKLTEQHKILDMMALAHHSMATFFLKRGKVKYMEEHAIKAYNLYVQLDKKKEMDETRCLTGIVQGEAILKDYINILQQAEDLDSTELKILILWKDLRIPFFSNVKLLQPEANTNLELKDRVEFSRNDEMLMVNKRRQAEMVKSMPSKFTMKPLESHVSTGSTLSSGKTMATLEHSPSVAHFKRHLRSAEEGSGASYDRH